jgi:hypothetical protein
MGLIVTITCADEVRREKFEIFATGHFASFSTQSARSGRLELTLTAHC